MNLLGGVQMRNSLMLLRKMIENENYYYKECYDSFFDFLVLKRIYGGNQTRKSKERLKREGIKNK